MLSNVVFVMDTPEMYKSSSMQNYMSEQQHRVDRQWVASVIAGEQENEEVRIRTDEFVVLPDLVRELPKHKQAYPWSQQRLGRTQQLNWLAIVTVPNLRTIRDLRGEHIELLRTLRSQCIEAVKKEFPVERPDIMIFANYPPSVYTLHFHICCPFKFAVPFDAFRMHTLESLIHHIEMDPEYYAKYNIHIPVSHSSRLYHAMVDLPGVDSMRKCFEKWKRYSEEIQRMNETKNFGLPCHIPRSLRIGFSPIPK